MLPKKIKSGISEYDFFLPIEWGWRRGGGGERWSRGPVGKRFSGSITYRKDTSEFMVSACIDLCLSCGLYRGPICRTDTFLSPEWDDCRRETKSTSKGAGCSTEWGSKEATDRTERRTTDSEVRVYIGQQGCLRFIYGFMEISYKNFLSPLQSSQI